MSYRVAFLDDKEFEQLPGKNMEDKIGVAYPKLGEAYVRKTGSNLVDVFTLSHELEHLQGATHDEHYDEENECYYKGGFMQALLPVLAGASFLIPGVGPAIGGAMSSMMGGLGGAASGLGGLFSGALGSVPGIGGALSGAASSIGSGIGSVASGLGSAASGAGTSFANAGRATQGALGMGGGVGGGSSALNSFGVPSVASGGEQAASLGGQLGAGALATPTSPMAAITGGSAGAGLGGGIGGALSKVGQLGGALQGAKQGMGAMGIGQKPQQAQQPSYMNAFQGGQNQSSQQDPASVQTGQGSMQSAFGGGYGSRNPLDPFHQAGNYSGRAL